MEMEKLRWSRSLIDEQVLAHSMEMLIKISARAGPTIKLEAWHPAGPVSAGRCAPVPVRYVACRVWVVGTTVCAGTTRLGSVWIEGRRMMNRNEMRSFYLDLYLV
jgi:hypothetical protein